MTQPAGLTVQQSHGSHMWAVSSSRPVMGPWRLRLASVESDFSSLKKAITWIT